MTRCPESSLTLLLPLAMAAVASILLPDALRNPPDSEIPRFPLVPIYPRKPSCFCPQNIQSPLIPTQVLPAVMVPPYSRNIARGKLVTSSDHFPVIGELKMVVDGDKRCDYASFVEIGPGKQWIQIDLGEAYQIHAIVIWRIPRHVSQDVVVQIGNEKEMAVGLTTVFNNDHDNSSGFGRGTHPSYRESKKGTTVNAHDTVGRYVRIYSNGTLTGSPLNQYVEVEVHASPAKGK